ncbi:hypothetical protein TNCV_828391 [Trichonephila clavipes]|nr:hypothetical protein TNCV_828391 [Trichonephila clavipes]
MASPRFVTSIETSTGTQSGASYVGCGIQVEECDYAVPVGQTANADYGQFLQHHLRPAIRANVHQSVIVSDLTNGKRVMIIRVRLTRASVSRTANLVDVSRTTVSRVITIFTNLEPSIHENYSTGAACCEHSWQSSYSKTVSFSAKRYEETRVVPRPPELDTMAIGMSSGLINLYLHYT